MKVKIPPLLRYAIQVLSLASFVFFLAALSYPPEIANQILHWFSRLDPWLLLSHIRWWQEIPFWVWLPLLTIASTLLWGRIFCGWLCPFGALLALTDKVGRTAFQRLSPTKSKVLHALQPIRDYWFLIVVVVFFLGSNWVLFLTPFALFSHELVRVLQGDIPWVLVGITVATLFLSRIWCSVLCPTGVLLSLTARLRFFSINSMDEVAATRRQDSRRQFFKAAFAVAVAGALWRKTVWAAEKVLRPPGALPEAEFTAVCNRCGRCVQVCPGNALRPMPITDGLANFETPYIIPRKNRCDLCLACQKVCPTGAITEIPLEKVRMGKAVIDKPRCIAWNEGKLCYICGEQCPVLAIEADERHRPSVLSDKCAGCGSCENACPVEGEAAIRVFP